MEIKDKELHRIAITAIIYNDEGKYLITKRSLTKKASPGKWTVPGGGLNIDDYINSKPSVISDIVSVGGTSFTVIVNMSELDELSSFAVTLIWYGPDCAKLGVQLNWPDVFDVFDRFADVAPIASVPEVRVHAAANVASQNLNVTGSSEFGASAALDVIANERSAPSTIRIRRGIPPS